MTKIPYKNSRFDDSIVDAMIISNTLDKQNGEKEKFNLIDAHIISVVHSYDFSNNTCFASNKYFANCLFTTEPTIQKSINKLCDLNFISKKISYKDGLRHRVLIYNEDVVEKFKTEMSEVLLDFNEGEDEE